MDLYTMPRAAGKSTAILRWLADDLDNRVAVVATSASARCLQERLIAEYQVEVAKARRAVVGAWSAPAALRGRRVRVAVDDVDDVLGVLLGANVELATMT